jgi:hypothetical protein
MDSDSSDPTRQAIRISGRRDFDEGMMYNAWRPIEIACLQPGSIWEIVAQLQLIDRVPGKGVSCEDPKVCPTIRVFVKDDYGNEVFLEKYPTVFSNARSFNIFRTELMLPTPNVWDGKVGNVIIDIRNFPVEYDLLVGAFSMKMIS